MRIALLLAQLVGAVLAQVQDSAFHVQLSWQDSGAIPSGAAAVATLRLFNDHNTLPLVLLPWDTPLEQTPADPSVYSVLGGKGQVAYLGMSAKRINQPPASAFITVEPLSSVSISVDIDQFWNVRAPGTYSVSSAAVARHASRQVYLSDADVPDYTDFHSLSLATDTLTLHVDGPYVPHAARSSGKRSPLLKVTPDVTVEGDCSAVQRQAIIDSAAVWHEIALQAGRAIAAMPDNAAAVALYKKWFDDSATLNDAYVTDVQQDLLRISYNVLANQNVVFKCGNLGMECSSNTIAYTYPGVPGEMFLCDLWYQITSGTFTADSQAGTIQHEASHWVLLGGSQDHAYGYSSCLSLARNQPAMAIDNADNIQFFTEESNGVVTPADECAPLLAPDGARPAMCLHSKHGDICSLSCRSRHIVSGGDAVRTCQMLSNGTMQWSGQPLLCQMDLSQCITSFPEYVRDGYCDASLNNVDCSYDGGDCCAETCEGNCGENAQYPLNCQDPGVLNPTVAATSAPVPSTVAATSAPVLPTVAATSSPVLPTAVATSVVCSADSGFADTPGGSTASMPCASGLIGDVTRVCSPAGVWNAADYTRCSTFRYVGSRRPGSGVMADAQACQDACTADSLCAAHTYWPVSSWCELYQDNGGVKTTKSSVSAVGRPKCGITHIKSIFDSAQPNVTFLSRHVLSPGRNEHLCCDLCASNASCAAFSYKWKGKCLLFSQADVTSVKATSSGSWSGMVFG